MAALVGGGPVRRGPAGADGPGSADHAMRITQSAARSLVT